MRPVSRLLHLARLGRLSLPLTIGLGFTGGLLAVCQAWLVSRVINRVFLMKQSLEEVASLLGIAFLIILVRAIFVWGAEVSASAVAERVKTTLRERLFQRLLSLGPVYLGGERTGELSHVIVEGIEALEAFFSQYLPQLALAGLVPLTVLFFVFPLDALSGVILLFTAPLLPVFMILIGNLAEGVTRKQWLTLSRMSAYFLDVLQGLTTLKILGRSREQIQVIARLGERYRETTMQVLKVSFMSALALEFISTISTALVAVEIGLRLLYNRGISFEQALFVLILAPEFYLPLRLLGTRFHAAISGITAAGRIFEVLDEPGRANQASGFRDRANIERQSPIVIRQPLFAPGERIVFKDVRYSYAGDRVALKGVSFEIPVGSKIALVGPSGAGKSTIAHILLRFIQAQAGAVEMGGVSLQDIPVGDWRAGIAWVPQKPHLFHDTIAANLRIAKPVASLEELVLATRQAGLHDFIQALPRSYATVVGEGGARLSGGQAQRLALARAFLKGAPFLIMDEAVAQLDPQTEAECYTSWTQFLAGRTALIIAHRLNTVRLADRILVMQEGKIVAAGDYRSLLEQDGLFRRLVLAQEGEF